MLPQVLALHKNGVSIEPRVIQYSMRLANGSTITVDGCHFLSFGMTELNHLTNYNYIGGG